MPRGLSRRQGQSIGPVDDVKDKFDGDDDAPAEQDADTADTADLDAAPEQTHDVADDSLGRALQQLRPTHPRRNRTHDSRNARRTAPIPTDTLSETAGGAGDLGDGYADADSMTEGSGRRSRG
jgi:hypothetical protein